MSKRLIFVVLVIMLAIFFWGAEKTRDQKIAELESQLPKVSGREKVDLLNRLSSLFLNKSVPRSMDYGRVARRLALQITYPEGEAAALRRIAECYNSDGKLDTAIETCLQAKVIYEKLGDKFNIADSLYGVGFYYKNIGDLKSSQQYYFEALKIFREIDNKWGIAATFGQIGLTNLHLGAYDTALDYTLKALKISESNGFTSNVANSLFMLGVIYKRMGQYRQGVDYFHKSLKIFRTIGIIGRQAEVLDHLGDTYRLLNNLESARSYLEASLAIKKRGGYKSALPYTLNNLGRIYLNLNNELRAFNCFQEAWEILKDVQSSAESVMVLNGLGEVCVRRRDFEGAQIYLDQALAMAREIKYSEQIKESYFLLSGLFAAKKDYRRALENYKHYSEVKDRIFTEESSRKVAEMQARYETEKKEREIELLKKDKAIQALRLSRERLVRYTLISGILLVLVIFGLLFKKYVYLFAFWKKEKYIGRFRLTDRIGGGGMATVFKAHSIRDKSETVAVKVLREELFTDEVSKRRFKQEAAIIDKLDHPHIIRIFERGEHLDKLFIAMELLTGITLEEKIRQPVPLAVKETCHIVGQVCDALVLIHSKNIVHRDIKPANIMLIEEDGDENFVKLLDFGLARTAFETRVTQTGIMVGTVSYMSPEQIVGSEFSPAGDVYSLGVVMYEMVTGKKPFHGDTKTEILRQILDHLPIEPLKFRPTLPPELNTLILHMLAKDKTRRPPVETVLEKIDAIHLRQK